MTKPIIVIAAGGTGGHMFPALAFAQEAVKRGADIALITDPRGRKYTEGFPSIDNLVLSVTNAEEGGLIGKFKSGLTLLKSIGQVTPFLKNHIPSAIIGFGGYPTAPALWAANCPVIIHEQNAVLGRVNRFFQKKAVKVCSGFSRLEGLEFAQKHIVVGNPVRAEIVAIGEKPFPEVKHGETIRILITGGSQGARALGQAMSLAIADLDEYMRHRIFVSHQVRDEQCEEVREIYADAGIEAEVWPFFRDMATRLEKAHLVIGRSGASTVSETAVAGRTAIFVPLPSAMNDHQTFNAQAVAETGGADLLRESEMSLANLKELLENRLSQPEKLKTRGEKIKTMGRPNAAKDLCDIVFNEIEFANIRGENA